MTARDLATALFAVLGVYLLFAAITNAGLAVFYSTLDSSDEWLRQSHTDQALASVVFVVLQVGFALCVLRFRSRIAAALFPGESQPARDLSVRDLQAALCSAVGLYFAIRALAVLGQGFASLSPGDSISRLWPSYASSMIEAGFGVAVLFGARAFVGAWTLAREAGRRK